MNPRVRFEDEADQEYRLAGRWYEERRQNLGFEFFDAVDETIERILALPRSGTRVPLLPPDLPVRGLGVTRVPYHVVYLETNGDLRILAIAHDRRKQVTGNPDSSRLHSSSANGIAWDLTKSY